jgi:hypothetical protein
LNKTNKSNKPADFQKEKSMSKRTEWLAKCGWGVFVHYLGDVASSTDRDRSILSAEEWNERVEGFDVAGLARQLQELAAPYIFITVGQGSGHYLAPNETYDRLTGILPSKCSRRDLVSDLYAALNPLGIKLLVYVPCDGPNGHRQACDALGLTRHPHWMPRRDGQTDAEYWRQFRDPVFQTRWQDICRDWSLRWGNKVSGWWVDGAYGADVRFPENEEPNLESLCAALRAGNPEAIVAINDGVFTPVRQVSRHEDYTAGESNDLPICPGGILTMPDGHRSQYHILSFLGSFWGRPGEPRFTDELAAAYTADVVARGGVISWDVPTARNGQILPAFFRQLTAISAAVRQIPAPLPTPEIEVSQLIPGAGQLATLSYPGTRAELVWTPGDRRICGVAGRTPVPFCSVRALFADQDDALVFFRATVTFAAAGTVTLLLGYDGPVKLWLDGQERYRDLEGTNPANPDEGRVECVVTPGAHEVMVALGSNRGKAWGIYLRYQVT